MSAIKRTATHRGIAATIVDESSITRETLGRLEASLANMSDSFSIYRDDVATLKIQQANQQSQMTSMAADWKSSVQNITTTFQSEISKIGADIGRVTDRINERDKPRRELWIGITTAAIAFIGMFTVAAAFFVNAEIGTNIAPLVQQSAATSQLIPEVRQIQLDTLRSSQADTRSEQDRAELNRRVGALEGNFSKSLAERREQVAELNAGRIEIETQFKNLTAMVYYIFHKVTGDPYPIVPREETK